MVVIVTALPRVSRTSWLGAVLASIALWGARPTSCPAQTVRLQCGDTTEGYESVAGLTFVADRAYSTGVGYGYVGGSVLASALTSRWFLGGTQDKELYLVGREGIWEYRFDLAPGAYVLTLHLMEIDQHGPGFRRFDIRAEDEIVVDELDVFSRVEKDYAFRRRVLVDVDDGRLEVRGVAGAGAPLVGAIEVEPAVPDAEPPPAPGAFAAVDLYEATLLTWGVATAADIAGYVIYRSTDGTQFDPIAVTDDFPRRHVDATADVGVPYTYRVAARDVYGNEGPASAVGQATALPRTATLLPVYTLTLTDDALTDLNRDVWSDELVPCRFAYGGYGLPYSAVRYRGNSARELHKKSYKLDFGEGVLFEGQSRLNLNGDFGDNSLLRNRLGLLLAARLDVPAPTNRPCRLFLNDTDRGVFGAVEDVDERFLERVGLDPAGDLYKCSDTLVPLGSAAAYRAQYENQLGDPGDLATLIAFIEELNSVSEADFPAWVGANVALDEVLTEYALNILIANNDFTGENYFLHRDGSTGRWSIVPWDLDSTFRDAQRAIDHGTPGSPDAHGHNVLITRLLDVDLFRYAYVQHLSRALEGPFEETVMWASVDSLFAEIELEGIRDIHKIDFESSAGFLARPMELKTFVTDRIAHLGTEIPGFAPDPGGFVVVNELMARNDTTLTDEFGDHDDWVEIFNPTGVSFGLAGVGLTDDVTQPHKWVFPDVTLGPGEWMMVWLDGEPEEGPLHAGFKLSAEGEEVALFDRVVAGARRIDHVRFGPLAPDVSWGRFPDGSGFITSFATATPGAANSVAGNLAPVVTHVSREPTHPGPTEPVALTAHVTDDGEVSDVTVHVEVDGVPAGAIALLDDGVSGDGDVGDGVYGGVIPGFADGTDVAYFLEAIDDAGATRHDPLDAAEVGGGRHRYRVGFAPVALRINEFLASNTSGHTDEAGETDDWIEIRNCGASTVSTAGLTLTDDLGEPAAWSVPPVLLEPDAYLVIWADGDVGQGALHAPFALSAAGEEIGLFQPGPFGLALVDSVRFGPQSSNVSRGRLPDCASSWSTFAVPSPGAANGSLLEIAEAGPPPARPRVRVSPNPGRGLPRVQVTLPRAGRVQLCVYDVAGRRLGTPTTAMLTTGSNTLTWPVPGRRLAAGVYFLEARTQGVRDVVRVVLLP